MGASAFRRFPRQDLSTSFQLTASGGQIGILSQLSDGQVRSGSGADLSPTTFNINNGSITDSAGRGCIVTRKLSSLGSITTADLRIAVVEQFQCDENASAAPGFSITPAGGLAYQGNTNFSACPATDTAYNIYIIPVEGQTKCVPINLSTTPSNGTSTPGSSIGSGSPPTTGGSTSSPLGTAFHRIPYIILLTTC